MKSYIFIYLFSFTLLAPLNLNLDEGAIFSINFADEKVNFDSGQDSPPINCQSVPTPPGLSAVPLVYQNVSGHEFGTDINSNWVYAFTTSQYLAVSDIQVSFVNWRRTLQFYSNPTNLNPNYIVSVSISECPGDFTYTAVCNRVIVPSAESVVLVSTHANDNPDNYCIIEPNKHYYLNFVHDQYPFDGNPPRCAFESDNSCGIFFNEYIRN